MYLQEWGSSLVSDMIESVAVKIGAYLRKDRREKDYSSELTTPPSSRTQGLPYPFS
jgi:hypothetical protein